MTGLLDWIKENEEMLIASFSIGAIVVIFTIVGFRLADKTYQKGYDKGVEYCQNIVDQNNINIKFCSGFEDFIFTSNILLSLLLCIVLLVLSALYVNTFKYSNKVMSNLYRLKRFKL